MNGYATAAPPPDCVPVDEPDAERIGECWYARHVHALLAAQGLPAHVAEELRAWVRMQDANVRGRRPFLVEDRGGITSYAFAPGGRRDVPAWWRAAVASWMRTHAGGAR